MFRRNTRDPLSSLPKGKIVASCYIIYDGKGVHASNRQMSKVRRIFSPEI